MLLTSMETENISCPRDVLFGRRALTEIPKR